MPDSIPVLLRSIYAKTAQGQQEIASRSLGLSPMARRVLVLVDGKRSGQELSTFVPGNEVSPQLTELLERGCIEAVGTVPAPKPAPSPAGAAASTHAGDDLEALPPPESRSAKEADMARNFMINRSTPSLGSTTAFHSSSRSTAARPPKNCAMCTSPGPRPWSPTP